MTKFRKRIVLFFVVIGTCCTTTLFAQSATVSPYSSYGIGDLQNQNGAQSFSMGQTGIAMHNDSTTVPDFINLKNPASYFYNRVTTFEAGMVNDNRLLNTEGQKYSNNNTYFGYFAIAFPMGKYFGGSFGLRPMSSVGYNLNVNGNLDSIDSKGNQTPIANNNTTNQYVGTGGINQVHIGAAYSPCHWFSIGANLDYLFGYLNYTQNVIYPTNISAFNSQETENINLHGITGDAGMMFTLGKSRDSAHFIIGLTGSLGGNLFADYNLMSVSYLVGAPQTNIDTVQDSSASGRLRLPWSIGAGITYIVRDKYNNPKWTFSADYTYQNWSQYSLLGVNQGLSNSWQAGIGAQYIPFKNSTNFFQRIHYRAGATVTQTYLTLNDTPIRDYCLSLGIALPIGPQWAPPLSTQLGILSVGVQAGYLGTTSNNLLQEDYAKVIVSFTFNSRWFQKRLYQ